MRRSSLATSSSPKCPRPAGRSRKGQEAAVVESVKAASRRLRAGLGRGDRGQSGARATIPALINSDPEGEGWFFKLKLDNPGELDGLMDEAAYRDWVKTL